MSNQIKTDPAALGLAVTPAQREQWLRWAAVQNWPLEQYEAALEICNDHARAEARVAALTAELDEERLLHQETRGTVAAWQQCWRVVSAKLEAQAAIQAALTAELADAKKDWEQLKACEHEWTEALDKQAAIQAVLVAALEFYADPVQSQAVRFIDKPQGPCTDDYEYIENLTQWCTGKRARAALARVAAGGGAP